MRRSVLTWHAIRWRLGSSVAFFAVATVAMAAAALGPLYLKATYQSIVSTSLRNAAPRVSGVQLFPVAGSTLPPSDLRSAVADVPGGTGSKPSDAFEPAILTTSTLGLSYSPIAARADSLNFIARTGVCRDVRIVAGRCPLADDEVLLSTRTAAQLGARVGASIRVLAPGAPGTSRATVAPGSGPPPSLRLRVVGLYRPGDPTAPVWWGSDFFAYGTAGQRGGAETLDAGFVSEAGAQRLGRVLPRLSWLQLPLRSGSLAATDTGSFLSALSRWTARVQPAYSVAVGTGLPGILRADSDEEGLGRTVIVLVSLQLVLLSLLVLYGVARAVSSLRAGDVRVAELRGLPFGRLSRLVLREPIILLVAAVPAGFVVAWLAVAPLCAAFLGVAAPAPDGLTVIAVAVAFAAGVFAVVLGSLAMLRTQALQQSMEVAVRQRSRNAAVADALGLALAISGCADLIAAGNGSSTSNSPIALAGPGLLALGLGILAARLLPVAARGLTSLTRWSKRVALSLSARGLSRRDELARLATVPAIAAGLLVFAITGLVVSSRNDSVQAGFELGAPVVMNVQVHPGVDFEQAVRTADRGQPPAIGVVRIETSYGAALAIDSQRMARVVSWPADVAGVGISRLARELRPPVAPERLVPPGGRLVLTADLESRVSPPPDLQLNYFESADATESAFDFGRLREGTHRYVVTIVGLCTCRIDGLTLYGLSGADGVRLRLESLAVATGSSLRPLASGFTRPDSWRAKGPLTLRSGRSGLSVTIEGALAGQPPVVAPNDTVSPIPAAVTPAFVSTQASGQAPDRYQVLGIDAAEIEAKGVATLPAVPQIGGSGAVVDLGLAERAQQSSPGGATFEIWSRSAPSARFRAALAAKGIQVTGLQRSATLLAGLRRSGPALGFDLFSIAASAGLALAAAALLFATTSRARQRGIELAGLLASGVERRTLRGSLLLESVMIALTGAAAGILAGVLGALLALPAIPELPAGRAGPPLELGLPWLAVLASAGAVVGLLLLSAVAGALVVVRWVRTDQLRQLP